MAGALPLYRGDFSSLFLAVETYGTSFDTTFVALSDASDASCAIATTGEDAGASTAVEHRAAASDGETETAGPIATVTLTRGVLTDVEAVPLPAAFDERGAYPNPSPSTPRIAVDLPWVAEVTI